MKIKKKIAFVLAMLLVAFTTLDVPVIPYDNNVVAAEQFRVPDYEGKPYKVLRSNLPKFSKSQKKNKSAFENYSSLDSKGRCGVAFANICKEIMPTKKRESISEIHPSGWQSNMKWERCHLIGFQLAGENANDKNLITGSHYFNVTGMLPFENKVDDYVDATGNHVLYRVTPVFESDNLIASGVIMEAWSVEDKGKGVCFNVFVYNVQPGSTIDYKAGYVKAGAKKLTMYIANGTYKGTVNASDLQAGNKTFKIGCSAPTKLTYKKKSGSAYLSVNNNGNVTVKKGTPAGTYYMKVKIKAAASLIFKSKTITKTISVTVSNDIVSPPSGDETYVLNTNTKVFHLPGCSSVKQMSERNKQIYNGNRESVISMGYKSCGRCHP